MRIGREDLVILRSPGHDRSIRMEDFAAGRAVSQRYRNRRIGEFLKELDLTEGRSTGVPKILKAMAANGSSASVFETDDDRTVYLICLPLHLLAQQPRPPTPEVTPVVTGEVAGEVTGEVVRLLGALSGDMSRQELQHALGLKHEDHFRAAYLKPALKLGLIEMTLPDVPRSSKQRYRLTAAGTQAKVPR